MEIFLNDSLGKTSLEVHESANSAGVIILAHGAGAGMHHPFMVGISDELASHGFHAIRFNFPYMEEGQRSPGSPKKNTEAWNQVVNHVHEKHPDLPIFLSGKSYGGRMASHLLAERDIDFVKGIIYLGFPLHAPGKDSKDRANHLNEIRQPQLFLQGTKDKLANIDLMKEVVEELEDGILHEIADADHSFNVPKRVGITKNDMIKHLGSMATDFMKKSL